MRPSRHVPARARISPSLERRRARGKIDRPAVVGIDQAEIPELGALIEIGHARDGEPQQALREAVHRAGRRNAADEGRDLLQQVGQRTLGDQCQGKAAGGVLVGLVDGGPVAEQLGLTQRLLLPRRQPPGEFRAARAIAGIEIDWPGADDGLQQHGDVAGCRRAVGAKRLAGRDPARLQASPLIGHAAQHREAGAYVLAALVIMRGRRQHRMRMAGGPRQHAGMEGSGVEGKGFHVEADIVAREQPAVAIEGRVLDGLGGDGRAQLLKARHGELAGGRVEQAQDRVDSPAVGGEAGLARAVGCLLQHRAVDRREGAVGGVGAIDREMRQQLGEHAPQGRPGDLARRQGGRTGFELGGEASRHDLAPRRLFLGREPGRAPAQRRPGRCKRRFARRIVLKRAHVVHEIVAGGAVARPVARQGLAAQQDLFDHQPGPLAQPPAQRPAIACRIGEAVDMVDAQAVYQPLGMKAERQGVHGFEDFRLLHAQADQLVDVEEAPPVDAVAGAAPPGEAIVLAFQHVAQRTRAAGRKRQAMGEVAQRLLPHLDLARRQRLLQRLAQDRQQDLVAGQPVDVEEAGISAGAAMAQHVGPPGIGGVGRHVIGHDVDDQAEARGGELGRQRAQRRLAAQFGIDLGRIDDVVAVHRARPRDGDGRRVEMADAQAREIGHQRLGVGEGEALVKLQPQGGARDHGRRRAMILARACTAGDANKSFAAGARRRRQLGCSSTVPGRLGCSARPSRSSSGASISGDGDCAT